MTKSDHEGVRSEGVFDARIDRRKALGGAAAILGAAGMVAVGSPVFAQDATPEASPAVATSLPTIPPEIEEFANDWPMAQRDYASTRHAVGSTIDSTNVSELGVAWEYKLMASSPFGAITSNPVVQGDRIYIIDNSATVQCLSRDTGEVVWAYEQNVSTFGPNGVAVGYGILVGVAGDTAEVFALDAETGEHLWTNRLSYHSTIGITMAPAIYDGYVIVSTEPGGNSKGIYGGGANGVVYCLEVETGVERWNWDTVEEDLWGNFAVNSGGGLWYPPSIDVETGVLYMGIGNAGPFPGTEEFPSGESRPGMNNYANCLVALDPNQGKVLWYINVKPRDYYDHDNQLTPLLGTVTIGGEEVDAVFTTGKHGFVVAAGRESGHEFWRRSIGLHKNDLMLELPEEPMEFYPGILGGAQSPMAFADGVLYVATLNYAYTTTDVEYEAVAGYESATSNVYAFDGATGDVIWEVELPSGIAGPGLTLANDVVFIGTLDGIARGFSTADGSEVWRSQTSAGLNAPFAIAGDMLLVPAGSFIAASPDSPDPLPGVSSALIAYQLGATGEVTLAEPGTSDSETPEDSDTLVNVSAIDIAYEQTEITIAADTDVTISLKNNGVLEHDLVIEGTDYATALLTGGETEELVVNLPAGTYVYYCSIAGHREAGMEGTLIVE